ncbi:MAG: hypothetical protein EAZ92_00180 [Candidatus Kapaibacterium sp.]|nr:MAG: hypothetical protein EAZ92_00180 [Candidatus Kapabacteria bacterium]
MKILAFFIALACLIGLHTLLAWQVSLLAPIAFAWFFPDRAVRWTTLQMVLAWGGMIIASTMLAPDETARMLAAVFGILSRLPIETGDKLSWLLPVASIIFAVILGALCGWFGASLRRSLRPIEAAETLPS